MYEEDSYFNLEKAFKEEIKKPYYNVFYLDDFKLPYEKLDVSAIVSTFNRCPFDPKGFNKKLNPLMWCLRSLLFQKPKLKEIIVVDDASQDYTKEVVDSFKKQAEKNKIKLIYIRNNNQIGNVSAMDLGVKKANSKYLFLVDDDCIMTPYATMGGVYSFEYLEKKGVKIAAVNLPTYSRTSIPIKAVSKKDIGSISFLKGEFKTNKNAFPTESIGSHQNGEKFMDSELNILMPFSIQALNTYCICSKKAYEEVGGLRKTVINRGCDREFGATLIGNGYSIFFQPDPKFHCVHGSYGLNLNKKFQGPDWFKKAGGTISLKKAMMECDKPNSKTGMRISPSEYIYHSILSFFCLVYPRNKRAAVNWIEKVYKQFVKNADVSIFGNMELPILKEKEREKVWRKAINSGLDYIRAKEKNEIKIIGKVINEIKNKGEKSSEIFTALEKL